MDFLLDKDQRTLRESVRTLFISDRDQARSTVAGRGLESQPLRDKLARAGLLGTMRPASCGGRECSAVETLIILEEAASIAPLAALGLAEHDLLFIPHVRMFGDHGQNAKLTERVSSGTGIGSWCVVDPGLGTDPEADIARAEPAAEGWVINGSALTIVNGGPAQWLIVPALTDSAGPSFEFSMFLLDKGMPGLGWEAERIAGRAQRTGPGRLVLTEVRAAPDRLIGRLGGGREAASAVFDRSRVFMAALCLGIAQASLHTILDRIQTGPAVPGKDAIHLSALMAGLSEKLVEYETARLVTYRAAFVEDREGRPGIEGPGGCRAAARLAMDASDLAVRNAPAGSESGSTALNSAIAAVRRWLQVGKARESDRRAEGSPV